MGTAAAPIDPQLGPLADNGGPTPTHEPAPTSAATDHGSPDAPGSAPAACEPTDQRGVARPQRAACDVGAVERRNNLPIVTGAALTTPEDSPLEIVIAATDDDGDPLTLAIETPPAHGTLTGTLPTPTYVPSPNYYGADSFTITASDPFGSGDSATFSVIVTAVNDAPTAVDDTLSVLANGGAQLLAVLDNDSGLPDEGETLTVQSALPAAHGTVTVSADGSGVTYAPNANYVGLDVFTYTISDGNGGVSSASVQVTVLPTADLAVSLTASKDPVHSGERFKYFFTLTNHGPGQAANVTGTLTIPSDVTIHDTLGCSVMQQQPLFATVALTVPLLGSGAAVACEVTVSRIVEGVFTITGNILWSSPSREASSRGFSRAKELKPA